MSGKFLVRQHKDCNNRNPFDMVIAIDGDVVTTTTATTGLLQGAEVVKVKKGSGGSANEVTITFNAALRNAEYVVFSQCLTADCIIKPDTIVRAAGTLVFSTVKISNLSTAVNDADIMILIRANDDTPIS